jgi:hypothetical protein
VLALGVVLQVVPYLEAQERRLWKPPVPYPMILFVGNDLSSPPPFFNPTTMVISSTTNNPPA